MTSTAANNIVTISHRGVTNRNGVQNTIPALEKTVKKEKPDYVEIDVRETKDNQFVVLHDENLALLARMTGAGFGGCAIALVNRQAVDDLKTKVGQIYEETIGYAPSFYVADIGPGAHWIGEVKK
ncbi:MAG: glycerophosphodiester phosphodiesterase family protein [Leuconostoc citreum]